MKQKEIIDAIKGELAKHGVRYAFVLRGRHPRVEILAGDKRGVVMFSASPSCPFAAKRAVADVRRRLRTLGALAS